MNTGRSSPEMDAVEAVLGCDGTRETPAGLRAGRRKEKCTKANESDAEILERTACSVHTCGHACIG